MLRGALLIAFLLVADVAFAVDTPQTTSQLQSSFADGQAAGSITPQVMRNFAVSTSGTAGRDRLNESPRAYTFLDNNGKMDARRVWAQCAMAAAGTALTCGSTTTVSANATAIQGSHTITITGGTFATNVGITVSVSGLGVGGAALNSTVISVGNSTTITLRDPVQTAASGTPVTFTFNSVFNTTTDPGKSIYIGTSGMSTNIGAVATAPYVATITSCTTANACVLSVPATTAIPSGYNAWISMVIGTDDSAACTSTVTQALARGDRFIGVPFGSLVPTCTKELSWVIPRGEGELYFPPTRSYVQGPDAGSPPVPQNTVIPKLHFPHTAAQITASGSATCVVTGDSSSMLNPAITTDSQTMPAAIERQMDLEAPKVKVLERGVGGYQETLFDATPTGIGTNDTYWATNTSTPWLGSPTATSGYIYSLTPDCMFIQFSDNDASGGSYTTRHLYNYVANIKSWSHPVDLLFSISWPRTLGETPTTQDMFDSINMLHRTFAEVNGYGYIDQHRAMVIARDGYDPVRPALVADPQLALNFSGGNLSGQSYTYPTATTGYASNVLLDVTAASTFFTQAVNTSANGVGEIIWEVGCNLANSTVCGDNVVRLGIDNTAQGGANTGNAYIECDVDTFHPGAGCRTPGGVVPVVYGLTTNASVTSGSNSVTTSTASFVSGDEGQTLVIPTAGTTMVTGFKDYLLCNAHYVSTTNVTCFTDSSHATASNATTTLSAVAMQVGRGNPHIVSNFSITSDTKTFPQVGITVNGDFFDMWYDDPNQQLMAGHVIRFGGAFQPKIWWTGTAGNATSKIFLSSGAMQFVERPQQRMFTRTMTDFDFFGLPPWAGDSAADPAGPYSGGAGGHPSTLAGATVINPVVGAQNLCVTCQ